MYCKHCGKLISDDSKFCQHCGVNQNFYISENMGDSQIKEKEKSVIRDNDNDDLQDVPISSKPDESTSSFYDMESSDESDNAIKQLIEFVLNAIRITGIIIISFFALVISLMYIHNFILGLISAFVFGFLAYFLFRSRYSTNESKQERTPLYYTGMVIFVLFLLFLCFKFGEGMILSSLNNPNKSPNDEQIKVEKMISMDEQLNTEIKIAKTKLPMVIDEYVSWTNIRKSNGMLVCDYIIDDANKDLYQIDLSKYKEDFSVKLQMISYRKYLELCMHTGRSFNCHLISKWDRSKSVDITYGSAEIGELFDK